MATNPLKDRIAEGAVDFTPNAGRVKVADMLMQQETEEEEQPQGEQTELFNKQETGGAEQQQASQEAEEGTEAEAAKQTTGEASEGDGVDLDSIKTFADLQSALGVDNEEVLTSLTVDLGDDEAPRDMSLTQLVEKVREYEDYQSTATQKETQRNQEHQARVQQMQQKLDSDILQIGAFTEKAMERINQALAGAEMQNLRATNPAEWAARDQELRNANAELQQGYQMAHKAYMDQLQEQRQQFQQGEAQKIQARFPDWKEKNRWGNHTAIMQEFGFTPEEIGTYQDSRLIFAMAELHDARAQLKTLKAEKAKGQQAATKVKVEKPPLLRKRGPDGRFVAEGSEASRTTTGKQVLSRKGLKNAMQRLQKNKDTASAADVVKRRLFAVQ